MIPTLSHSITVHKNSKLTLHDLNGTKIYEYNSNYVNRLYEWIIAKQIDMDTVIDGIIKELDDGS